MNSISNIIKNASFQKINQTIKMPITNKILKFRQGSNVLTQCTATSLIITIKTIGTMGTVDISNNTLVTITSIEAEVIKEVECTKISFKTKITIMMTRAMSIINSYTNQSTTLECKDIIKTNKEAVIIQEVNNIKVRNKFSSTDRVLSMISRSTFHNYRLNWVIINKIS